MLPSTTAGHLLSTILRHDTKVTSYKIALLRAINDVVLAFPDLDRAGYPIAIPLRVLADQWIAYYWPFVDPQTPIRQGSNPTTDMVFRPALTALRGEWTTIVHTSAPGDGFFLVSELRVRRKRAGHPPSLLAAYDTAVATITKAVQQPIQFAGPKGQYWSVFAKPKRFTTITPPTTPLPGTQPHDLCLVLGTALWATFREVSLWVEALCIHEWCLFSERVEQLDGSRVDRGLVYRLLTDRPDNRRPLEWERNNIDILLMEGQHFRCPWTERLLTTPGQYDVDHLIPVSAYPN